MAGLSPPGWIEPATTGQAMAQAPLKSDTPRAEVWALVAEAGAVMVRGIQGGGRGIPRMQPVGAARQASRAPTAVRGCSTVSRSTNVVRSTRLGGPRRSLMTRQIRVTVALVAVMIAFRFVQPGRAQNSGSRTASGQF